MTTLEQKLASLPVAQVLKSTPIWEGPGGKGPMGGITYSLLCKWLTCKERFRIYVMEGLKKQDQFERVIEYGQMWHTCEEALAKGGNNANWQLPLQAYATGLCRKYPLSQEEIDKWYNVCKIQFPLYVEYWKKHQDVKDRTPIFQEKVFDVQYLLPSGRRVRLRGKFDSVDMIGKGKDARVYVQENKTKGEVDELTIKRQLTFDLQTMIYLTALQEGDELEQANHKLVNEHVSKYGAANLIGGVRYNVVRRPLSGGAGNIRQHKPTKSKPQGESKNEYYFRLRQVIEDGKDSYFMRLKCEVSRSDIDKFRAECLDPMLDALCDWWSFVSKCKPSNLYSSDTGLHWRHPYGVRNSLDEGYQGDVDSYLQTGSTLGLQTVDRMFTELN